MVKILDVLQAHPSSFQSLDRSKNDRLLALMACLAAQLNTPLELRSCTYRKFCCRQSVFWWGSSEGLLDPHVPAELMRKLLIYCPRRNFSSVRQENLHLSRFCRFFLNSLHTSGFQTGFTGWGACRQSFVGPPWRATSATRFCRRQRKGLLVTVALEF